MPGPWGIHGRVAGHTWETPGGITLASAVPRNIAVLAVSRRQPLCSQPARVPKRASQKPSDGGFRVEEGLGAVWTGFRGAIKVI